MTVSSVSQSFSFSAVRLNLSARPVTTSTTSPAAAKAEPDRVTLSPAATAPADDVSTSAVDGEAPVTPVKPPTRAERRADALFGALDADDDGAITEQEFTEGAAALLRRAGARRRARGGDDDDSRSERSGRNEGGDRAERGENRGSRRLERKLEEAFARVDANQDGSIDKEELTSALAQAGGNKRGGDPAPAPPTPPPGGGVVRGGTPGDGVVPGGGPAPAPGASPAPGGAASQGVTVSFSFTYVSIAVQRYTALQTPDATGQKQAA